MRDVIWTTVPAFFEVFGCGINLFSYFRKAIYCIQFIIFAEKRAILSGPYYHNGSFCTVREQMRGFCSLLSVSIPITLQVTGEITSAAQ
jgi:hypothetical protein